MSVEAISWALNLAPVPAERVGQPSSSYKFVLVGLANHAGPDGGGAFPSVRTLIRYTGLSERTVRTCLDRLQASGLIRPCDPAVVAARIKRADRRPQGWDLDLRVVRADFDAAELAALEHQFPGLTGRLAAIKNDGRPDDVGHGLTSPHPAAGHVDEEANGVPRLHPAASAGCNRQTDGVQLAQPRGAAVAPEPSQEPPSQPPAARRKTSFDDHAGLGGTSADGFFAALGNAWQLTASQRIRLAPAVSAALASGWTPTKLAAYTGGNTSSVRNQAAVLAARLSPAELPAPAADGSARAARMATRQAFGREISDSVADSGPHPGSRADSNHRPGNVMCPSSPRCVRGTRHL